MTEKYVTLEQFECFKKEILTRLGGANPDIETDYQPGEFDDAFIEKHSDKTWFDQIVQKDPPKWKKDSCVGMRMSDCPSDWLKDQMAFLLWKVRKERAKGEAAGKGKNGKFYWEGDEFQYKLLAVWKRRKENLELPF